MKTAIAMSILGLLALSQPALSASKTIASAPVGPNSVFGGAAMTCSIFNAGSDPIVLGGRTILDSSGVAQTLTADTCGATPLPPRHSCSFAYAGSIGGEFVCRVKATGATVNMRGVATFRTGAASVLMWSPIQ